MIAADTDAIDDDVYDRIHDPSRDVASSSPSAVFSRRFHKASSNDHDATDIQVTSRTRVRRHSDTSISILPLLYVLFTRCCSGQDISTWCEFLTLS